MMKFITLHMAAPNKEEVFLNIDEVKCIFPSREGAVVELKHSGQLLVKEDANAIFRKLQLACEDNTEFGVFDK